LSLAYNLALKPYITARLQYETTEYYLGELELVAGKERGCHYVGYFKQLFSSLLFPFNTGGKHQSPVWKRWFIPESESLKTVVALSFNGIGVDFYFEIDQIFGRHVRFLTP
jgi:hypothetical protein